MKVFKCRAVIIKRGKILLMHRFKSGEEYYALPGGTMKRGETPEETLAREVKEETNLNIKIKKKLWEHEGIAEKKHIVQSYFLAESSKGKLKLGGPELKKQTKNNIFIPEWVETKKLQLIRIVPKGISKYIVTIIK